MSRIKSSGFLALLVVALFGSGVARADEVGPGGEFGLYFGIAPGVAGPLGNPAPQLAAGFNVATGGFVRYHLLAGYSHLDPLNGIEIRPLTLGLAFQVLRSANVGFTIEPLLDVIGMETYFSGTGSAAFLFSSGVGVQGVLNFRGFFISLAPLNFQFRYAAVGTGPSSVVAGTGFGLNMPIRLAAGVSF